MKNDALGDRMKEFYEDRTRIKLPRRTFTIIRIDGKAFHTYTKGLQRPFDQGLIEDMNATTAYLCKNIQGAKFGYVQSDEISLVLTDFDDLGTHAWFDNNLQKMVSVAASMATARFNQLRMARATWEGNDIEGMLDVDDIQNFKLAMFDARAFQIPFIDEVKNYFIWRQQDAVRNSISSVAQSLYSTKELHGVKTDQMQEMIFQKGINWNDYDFRMKRGAVIGKVEKILTKRSNHYDSNTSYIPSEHTFTRNVWEVIDTPIFTQDPFFLAGLLSNHKGNADVEQSKVPYSPKIGDWVYYPVDAAPFIVNGIRKDEVEIYGDWSGGTNNAIGAGWVKLSEIEPYDESKVKYYDKQGKPYFKEITKNK
jgi:tRNA(His) 5'-end guanylyltransferase